MHDEKNNKEAAAIIVTSKKDSKERGKTMENKKKSFNFKKLKKDVQGITLIALVVTIIVLLILAGIALNLTIGENGIFSRAEKAANTWRNAETNEQLAMGELANWMANYMGEGNESDVVEEEPIAETKSFVGYYADTNGDKQADGIIFVDLADTEHSSGRWNNDTGGWSDYEYTPVTEGLKQYTVCSESYTGFNGQWTHPVLTAIDNTGLDRFYVMSLEDFNTGTYYTWYKNMTGYNHTIETSYKDLNSDSGKENTKRLLNDWGKYGDTSDTDVWGAIQTAVGNKENPTWFVPSKTEWAAFGDCGYTELGVNTGNYSDYGLSDWYWSSSQSDTNSAYYADFGSGYIDNLGVNNDYYVRLATTF